MAVWAIGCAINEATYDWRAQRVRCTALHALRYCVVCCAAGCAALDSNVHSVLRYRVLCAAGCTALRGVLRCGVCCAAGCTALRGVLRCGMVSAVPYAALQGDVGCAALCDVTALRCAACTALPGVLCCTALYAALRGGVVRCPPCAVCGAAMCCAAAWCPLRCAATWRPLCNVRCAVRCILRWAALCECVMYAVQCTALCMLWGDGREACAHEEENKAQHGAVGGRPLAAAAHASGARDGTRCGDGANSAMQDGRSATDGTTRHGQRAGLRLVLPTALRRAAARARGTRCATALPRCRSGHRRDVCRSCSVRAPP